MDLSPINIFQALQAASSQDAAGPRKPAEAQLKQWEILPGFYSMIQDVYLDRSVSLSIRWIAVIYFKNGVDKYWRKTAKNCLGPEEKAQIRSKVFNAVDEANKQLMAQNAYAVSKICRIDYPNEWPELFNDLTNIIKSGIESDDNIKLHNALQILNQIVKSLSAVRFGRSRAALMQVTPTLLAFISNIYYDFTQRWMQEVNVACMEIGYLCLKISGRLLSDGYEFANRAPEARNMFAGTVAHLQGFITNYDNLSTELLEKHIKGLGKLYHGLISMQPTAFLSMPGACDVIRTYLTIIEKKAPEFHREDHDSDESIEFWEKIIVQGLILIKKAISVIYKNGATTIRYRSNDDKEETKAAVDMLKNDIFNKNTISHFTMVLLTWYLRLRPSDLESWNDDPESWVNEDLQNAWEYQLRPCAEKVFGDIMANFLDTVVQLILSFVEKAINDDSILLKDASFCAFGLGSNSLTEVVDFNTMFENVFQAQGYINSSADYKIIRRRLCLIIQEWVSVKCSSENRIRIYQLLTNFLNAEDPLNDIVVQLTAVQALRFTIDDWDFEIDGFLPFLNGFIDRIFKLMDQVKQIESKLHLLQVISVITDRVGLKIVPYADAILKILPTLWEQAQTEHIIKGVILQTLTNLVNATGAGSSSCHFIVLPALKTCLDRSLDSYDLLFEDALMLWDSTVKKTINLTDDLIELFPHLLDCLDRSTESLYFLLTILESYVLLAPELIISKFALPLFTIFARCIPQLSLDTVGPVTKILSAFTLQVPIESYGESLVQSNLFQVLVETTLDPNNSPIAIVQYLGVFARMSFSRPDLVIQLLHHVAHTNGNSDLLSNFFELWFEKIDNMGHPKDRKLNCLGLTSFLKTNEPIFMSKLNGLFGVWSQLLDEINESQGDSDLYYTNDDFADPEQLCDEHTKRHLTLLKTNDIVHIVSLKDYIRDSLNFAKEANGGEEGFSQRWLSQTDPHVLEMVAAVVSK
ncbi:ARM repeat-containing protein [Nadsonia fulvescens var. elongata DSM 6958]|uniref:ARM repeat-containing protein n=1 Tax=Nadsonia fulvescens var. elongata DSM 6958 TaxID=857566 RepID=A0A1E3PQ87_9ASCO|nr:ARM repeat-containing protein [Nadsonia fulvescens var. elongata DSM 6958]